MAVMIPDEIQTFTTDGEGVFYRFLKSVAKPDHQYLAWYLPDIQGREPDFIVFSEETGLVIFEVKDWGMDQIVAADPQNFTLYIDGREEKRENPLHQARDYFYLIMDKIKDDGQLVSKEAHAYGNVKIPFNYGVVFPNINKYEYQQKRLDEIITTDRIFFWDDLHPESPICSDSTGRCFLENMKRMFSLRFEFSITGKELNHLKQLLFPTLRIDLPIRDGHKKRAEEADRLKLLDHHQESIARQYQGGHRIITGPSGSGKTLILVYRAAMLKQYNHDVRRILFVCYNITLVNYIRRLLADKKIPMGDDGVDVLHFFELCARIIGEDVQYEKEDEDYYKLVIQEAQEKLPSCQLKYDAILVDEGQDFSNDMLRVVMPLLNAGTNHLTIAIDENQDIYEPRRSWKEVGINARGRVHRLSWTYRNTKEITDLALLIAGEQKSLPDKIMPDQLRLFPDTFEMTRGPSPELKAFSSLDEIIDYIAGRIMFLTENEGYPYSEIAIVYTMKSPEHAPGIQVPVLIGKALEKRGILHQWISEDYRAKRSYDVTTDRVTISTVHSVKGLDYACVFIVGLDWLEPGRWTEKQIGKIAYVAVTRAQQRLFIPYCFENNLIRRILKGL